jgi:hypothetical protein
MMFIVLMMLMTGYHCSYEIKMEAELDGVFMDVFHAQFLVTSRRRCLGLCSEVS